MVLLDSVVVNVRGENVVLLKLAPRTPHQVQTTFIWRNYQYFGASLVAQRVRRLPALETQVRSLSWKDPLEKEMATQIPRYSCLENLMDGEAWEAIVHEVAKSRTQLSDFTFAFCR